MIDCRIDRPLRIWTLDTGRLNVLDLDAVRALRAAHAEAEADAETRAVLLRGRDDAFCAGLDDRVLAAGDDASAALLTEMGELLVSIWGSRLPLVIACRGHAVAAGAMLLLVADVRIGASGSYRMGFSEVRVGMPLPRVPVLLARERLDRRHLQQATLHGRLYGPEEACDVGFLDRCVPAERLDAEAHDAAEELATLRPEVYAGSLASVRGPALAALRDALRG